MSAIWYLLRCPEGTEKDYAERCQELAEAEGIQEITYFRYQRMMRYRGSWHLEKRALLPGYIFLSRTREGTLRKREAKGKNQENQETEKEIPKADIPLKPCEISYLKKMCSDDGIIDISRGVIKNGVPIITEGPLKGREHLIKKIDRHKRTAEISLPFDRKTVEVTVGLEIYQKEIWEES